MSILIPGMEMPTSCRACHLKMNCDDCEGFECVCVPLHQQIGYLDDLLTDKRRDDCPLVPVPPHGDLIDVEIFIATQREMYCENCERRKGMKNGKMRFVYDVGDAPCRACDIRDVLDALEDTPTIIPAEEGE